MFEKLLQAVEQDPSPQKRQVFLSVVMRLDSAEERGAAIAQYARALIRVEPLAAFDAMRYAWRLSPENPRLMDELKKFFLGLRRGDAAAEIERLRTTPASTPLESSPLELDIHGFIDDRNTTTTRGSQPAERTMTSPLPELLAPKAKQGEASEPIDIPELDFGQLPWEKDQPQALDVQVTAIHSRPNEQPSKSPTQSPAEPLALDFAAAPTEPITPDFAAAPTEPITPDFAAAPAEPPALPPQPEAPAPPRRATDLNEIALTFSEAAGRKHYAIYMDFVKTAGLNFRLLELAEGFSDSLLGLVHFIHYLRTTGKLTQADVEKAIPALRAQVMSELSDIKCQVRFLDLFEPPPGGAG